MILFFNQIINYFIEDYTQLEDDTYVIHEIFLDTKYIFSNMEMKLSPGLSYQELDGSSFLQERILSLSLINYYANFQISSDYSFSKSIAENQDYTYLNGNYQSLKLLIDIPFSEVLISPYFKLNKNKQNDYIFSYGSLPSSYLGKAAGLDIQWYLNTNTLIKYQNRILYS